MVESVTAIVGDAGPGTGPGSIGPVRRGGIPTSTNQSREWIAKLTFNLHYPGTSAKACSIKLPLTTCWNVSDLS